jgi:hypothetical protein
VLCNTLRITLLQLQCDTLWSLHKRPDYRLSSPWRCAVQQLLVAVLEDGALAEHNAPSLALAWAG